MNPMMQNPIAVAMAIFWNSLRSGFVQRLTSRSESLEKARPGSQNLITWSIVCVLEWEGTSGEIRVWTWQREIVNFSVSRDDYALSSYKDMLIGLCYSLVIV